MRNSFNNRGFGLLEVVVAIAIITIAFLALLNVYSIEVRRALLTEDSTTATFLAEEGIEAIRIMRDTSWATRIASMPASTTRYLFFTGSTFLSTTSPEYVYGRFLRSFTIFDVLRDGNDDIASTGTLDPNTKRVSVSVSWSANLGTTTKTLEAYLTNIFNN
jgi:prepilin-type N-terminal cleavage/methylation domain-containing protein